MRVDRALDDGAGAAVVRAVEEGALDPYAAMRRVLRDPAFAGALLADPGGERGAS